MDGPFGDLELCRELGGGQLAACLEEQQERHEAGCAHPAHDTPIHDRKCHVDSTGQSPPLVSQPFGSPPW